VQELIGWVLGKAFGTRKHKFHGAGREDVDVRMLGSGRPFVLEMIEPKVFDVDLAELEAEINRRNEGRLEILGLHWTEKARVRTIKETRHAKEYEALVQLGGEPDPARLAAACAARQEVVQHTPERVSHRRADLDRKRWVEFLAIERAPESGEGRWRVRLRTEHGTYVKEVLSGEQGRSQPSLADLLGVSCECVELDVLAILGDEGQEMEGYRPPPAFGSGV
jgi:tRNA pseudouridine synthase 10